MVEDKSWTANTSLAVGPAYFAKLAWQANKIKEPSLNSGLCNQLPRLLGLHINSVAARWDFRRKTGRSPGTVLCA